MPLATTTEPSPWFCADLHSLYSPDGGFTYYGLMMTGYDPSAEATSMCNKFKDGQGMTRISGIRRLVIDACRPSITKNTHYGFASYIGTTNLDSSALPTVVSKPDGNFIFSGKFGEVGLLGSNVSFPPVSYTHLTLPTN